MAAPAYVPVDPADAAPRAYRSPDHVPGRWIADRPAEVRGRQPAGQHFGYQGPDQGYALMLLSRFRDRLQLDHGESVDDVIAGCVGIALRRASLFGRAPVVHDLTVAFTIWGFLDPSPPPELVALRRSLFVGIADVTHHESELRTLVDRVPEATLRMSHQQVQEAYPARWRELVGA